MHGPDKSMSAEGTEQIVTYKPYMASLLNRLQNARATVCLQFDRKTDRYNSIVIDVNAEQEYLYIDELSPTDGHRLMKKGGRVCFDGRLKGVQLQFRTTVLAVETDSAIPMYQLALPESMVYQQRRRHFRAHVGSQSVPISLPLPLHQNVSGDLVDISASGFCSRLTITDSALLEEKQNINDAIIKLPGTNNRITCDIEVRSIRHYPEKGFALIGSEIKAIAPNHKTHVERLVAMLDRNQRRSHRV